EITELTTGETYDFRVAAINGQGTGVFGTLTGITTLAVPAAVGLISASVTASTATLAWEEPAANGSAITSYTMTWYLDADDSELGTQTIAAATSYQVTGLSEATAYYATVYATNAIGDGVPGNSGAFTTAITPEPEDNENDEDPIGDP